MKTKFTPFTKICLGSVSGIAKVNFLTIVLSLFLLSASAGSNNIFGKSNVVSSPSFFNELSIITSGQYLVISWEADKSTFDHFEVERSFDGQHFTIVGLVLDVPENSNTCMFKDKRTSNTNDIRVWYRIRSINKDGTVFYSSNSMYTYTKNPVTDCMLSVNPNPFKNSTVFNFRSSTSGFAEVSVLTLSGETLLSKQSNIIKGANKIRLEGLDKMTSGIYMARLSMNGNVFDNQRIVKN